MTSSKSLFRRPLRVPAALALAVGVPLVALLLSCGGSSSNGASNGGNSTSTIAAQVAACEAGLPQVNTTGLASNEASIVVDAGPCAYGVPYGAAAGTADSVFIVGSQNLAFTNVTICIPGTSTCQTIDHVLVDTGSSGVRIMSSVLGSSIALNPVTAGGAPVIECAQFADGFTWGSIRSADVYIGGTANVGEKAANIPIQVIGDSSAYTTPSACTGTGSALNDVASFGANGIIGVGLFIADCATDLACPDSTFASPLYYLCPTSNSCASYDALATQQVVNPVGSFTSDTNGVNDSNGVVVALPALTVPTGEVNVYGNLYFGVATQANNALPVNASVYLADAYGDFYSSVTGFATGSPTVPLGGGVCSNSFIDSGSNGIFLPQSVATIPYTPQYWFDPSSTITFTALITGATGFASGSQDPSITSPSFTFSIADATTLFAANGQNNTAYSSLGGAYSTGGVCDSATSGNQNSSDTTSGIDWGLPFFYGRTIVIGNEYLGNQTGSPPVTVAGSTFNGPFWAF